MSNDPGINDKNQNSKQKLIKIGALIVAMIILWLARVFIVKSLAMITGLAALIALALVIYQLVLCIKDKKNAFATLKKPVAVTASLLAGWWILAALAGVMTSTPAEVTGRITASSQHLQTLQSVLYTMGLEDAVVTTSPDSELVVAFALTSENPSTEVLAKSSAVTGAAANIIPTGRLYTLATRNDLPSFAAYIDLTAARDALTDDEKALTLHENFHILEPEDIASLWQ